MKHITTIILFILIVCCSCYGQRPDSSKGGGTVVPVLIPKGFYIHDVPITTTGTLSLQQQDTIKVIMLVCDTSHSNHGYDIDPVHWQYGYATWRHYGDGSGKISMFSIDEFGKPVDYSMYRIYLDENKKPLSKNIIVWQTIEVK